MARKLSSTEKLVWELHCSGLAISQISEQTKLDESFIRATITGAWSGGGMVR